MMRRPGELDSVKGNESERHGGFFSLCCDFFTLSEMETLEVFEQKRELT